MRVLHVIPSVAPRYGGPSTAVAAMCDALNRIPSVFAEVVATDMDGAGRFDPTRWTSSTRLRLFPRNGLPTSRRSSALADWLTQHTREYDVIHTHSVWNSPVYAACRAARRAGKPLVYRPCGMLSEYSWSRRRLVRYAYWLARERSNVQAAAALHCTSEGEAADVRGHRAVRGTVRVIPNGVESAAWTTPRDSTSLRVRCGAAAEGKPILLYLSRLHPKKGLTDFLLPALAAIGPAVFLAVVGGEDDHAPGYKARVEAEILRLGLSRQVALLGPVDANERWAMFDGADAFVLPSRSENFGIVVAEAMARGCPVVVTDGVQSCEHVARSGAGVVTAVSVEGVTDGVRRVLAKSRDEFGQTARSYARTHFDWDVIALQLRDLYAELLGQGPK